MKTYDSFVFRITRDTIRVDEKIHTTVPERVQITVLVSDEDIKQGNAVQLAFEMAMEEYLDKTKRK